MRIGFFDSGLGGLTVLKEAIKQLPNENFIYYADPLHVPYGTKPKEQVKKYVFEAVDFMAAQGLKGLVIACNTATSIAIKDLRKKYPFPIIGMEPAVKPAVEKNGEVRKRVLVLATPLTLQEEKFQNLVARVDGDHIVDLLPLPQLVMFAERLEFGEEIIGPYLKEKLASYNLSQYGTIVLGCTHFPFYREVFQNILPRHINVIDGNLGTVKHLKNILEERGELNSIPTGSAIIFYASGKKVTDQETLKIYQRLLLI